MSIARHHSEWLSLIDISGPFLSLPVLLRVFPHGLDGHDPNTFRAFRRAYEEWQDNQQGLRPDPAIHDAWVRFVLSDILGFHRELIHSGSSICDRIKATLPQYGETLRPDLVIQHSGKPPRLLLHTYPPTQGLSKPLTGQRWAASPETRMAELLRGSGVALGLVTNGERWTLIHATSGQTATFASWDALHWLEEPITFRAFRSLLSVDRTFGVADDETLDALFAQSVNYQQEVTEQLGEQVLRAIEVLVRTLDRIDQDQQRKLLRDVTEGAIYDAAVTFMMRLVVLFYAEERQLIPGGHQLFYETYYAASPLRARLRAIADEVGEEVLERRSDAWSRLLATCRVIYGGVQHEDLRLPAYGGRLFNPDRFPFLEGRSLNTSWRDELALPLPVDNRTVLHLLEALQMLKVKIPGGGPAEARRLSFKTLDIEQIGYVYEGLLDHTVQRAREPVLGFIGTSKQQCELPLSVLEGALASTVQPRSRNATQFALDLNLDNLPAPANSPTTLALLEEKTGRSANAIKRALLAPVDPHHLEQLLIACEHDNTLFVRIRPFINLLRRDSFERYIVYLPGSFYVTSGANRRNSGAYYTPRSLTEPVVQHTLDSLVYDGPDEGRAPEFWVLRSAEHILSLTICDITVGSGAFLVQTCRYLADRLCEASVERVVGSSQDQGLNHLFAAADVEERLAHARRLVADRCLYGVDKNPLAVEITKLSLWLITLRQDRPFTFLDHAIKCGDSLLGLVQAARFAQALASGQFYQLHLIQLASDNATRLALEGRYTLRRLVTVDIRDAEQKQQLEDQANEKLRLPKLGADLLTAAIFIADRKRREQILNFWFGKYLSLLPSVVRDGGMSAADLLGSFNKAHEELRAEALSYTGGDQPFHWPFEFPEVFFESPQAFSDYLSAVASGRQWSVQDLKKYGFSAIIGNPPFQGGQKITGTLGVSYRDYLVEEVAHGKRGSADLCAYFFLRAGELARSEGVIGLVATNTIAQGDTRQVGLEQLVTKGFSIHRAISSQPWPGASALEIAQVWLRKAEWQGERFLDEQTVLSISPFLTVPGSASGTPYRLKANEEKSFIGSYVLGMGFVLTPEDAQQLIESDSRNCEVLFPYVNGEDLNSRPDQSPSRWVINFHDWPLEQAATYPEPFRIVLENVKPERDKNNRAQRREKWWQYAERQPALIRTITKLGRVLVTSRVSTHHFLNFSSVEQVFSDRLVVIALPSFADFSLLSSRIHDAWAHRPGATTHETRNTYFPLDAFETFPFPASLTGLHAIGEAYHEHRRQLMLTQQEGLTKTYNRFHNSAEASEGIAALRRLHVAMDQAVAAAYGWSDMDFQHGFHQTKQGLRYTISEAARRAVLDRLLALNHERYAEEVALDLHDKGAKKAKGTIRRPKKLTEGQGELF